MGGESSTEKQMKNIESNLKNLSSTVNRDSEYLRSNHAELEKAKLDSEKLQARLRYEEREMETRVGMGMVVRTQQHLQSNKMLDVIDRLPSSKKFQAFSSYMDAKKPYQTYH